MSEPMRDEVVRPNLHVLFEGMARVYDQSEADALFESLEDQLKAALSANREKDAEIERIEAKYHEEQRIVDRVWKALGISTYAEAGGKAIDEIVASLRASGGEKDSEIEKLKAEVEHHMDIIVEFQNRDASGGEKWIEIKEGCEMPEDGVDILFNIPWCYGVEKGGRFEGKWISDRTSPYNDEVSFDADAATHWMPLLSPPTLNGEKE